MKMICIDNKAYPYGSVTLGNKYDIDTDGITIWFVSDKGEYFLFFRKDFLSIEEYREQQLNKII